MNARRVELHELYREIESLGGATNCAEDRGYNKAVCDVLQTLRAAGFGDGCFVAQGRPDPRDRPHNHGPHGWMA